MIDEKTTEVIDRDLIIQFAEDLIKEMKGSDPELIGSTIMDTKQSIHGASITAKKLAQVTGSKFYYEVTRYLMER